MSETITAPVGAAIRRRAASQSGKDQRTERAGVSRFGSRASWRRLDT
jgi:hypothetical protein